jgi:hypothetical protein
VWRGVTAAATVVSVFEYHQTQRPYLGFLLQVECVNFLKLTFLTTSESCAQTNILYKHTTRKKKVALFACNEVCGSSDSTPWLLSLSGGITGVALSFLMSYKTSVGVGQEET